MCLLSVFRWVAGSRPRWAASNPNGIAGLVLVDAVGIEIPGQDVLDVFSIAPSDYRLIQLSRARSLSDRHGEAYATAGGG